MFSKIVDSIARIQIQKGMKGGWGIRTHENTPIKFGNIVYYVSILNNKTVAAVKIIWKCKEELNPYTEIHTNMQKKQ